MNTLLWTTDTYCKRESIPFVLEETFHLIILGEWRYRITNKEMQKMKETTLDEIIY